MMNEKERFEIENLLQSIPNNFKVIENKIDTKVIDEYYKIYNDLEDKNEIIPNQDSWKELKLADIKKLTKTNKVFVVSIIMATVL